MTARLGYLVILMLTVLTVGTVGFGCILIFKGNASADAAPLPVAAAPRTIDLTGCLAPPNPGDETVIRMRKGADKTYISCYMLPAHSATTLPRGGM